MMNKRFFTVAFMVTALIQTTACAQKEADSSPADSAHAADVQALTDACLEMLNLDEQICRCMADKAKEDLSETAFKFLLATLQEDQARTEQLRRELSLQEAMQAGMFLVHAPADCGAENASEMKLDSGDDSGLFEKKGSSKKVSLPDDAFFTEFAYPGAILDDVLTMGGATSAWFRSSDDFSKITDFYSGKFEGGNNIIQKERAYFFSPPNADGSPFGATVTKQPDGSSQIILKREQE